jgi:hypothetical protein
MLTAAVCMHREMEKRCQFLGRMNQYRWLAYSGYYRGFFSAQFFSATAVIGSNGSFEIQPWKTYFIFVAILTYGTFVSLFGNRFLGRYNDGVHMSHLAPSF